MDERFNPMANTSTRSEQKQRFYTADEIAAYLAKYSQERFLRDTHLAERYDLHRNSIWRLAREGKIPQPVTVGGSKRWRLSEILAFELANQ